MREVEKTGSVKLKHHEPGPLGSAGSRQKHLEVSQCSCLETAENSEP